MADPVMKRTTGISNPQTPKRMTNQMVPSASSYNKKADEAAMQTKARANAGMTPSPAYQKPPPPKAPQARAAGTRLVMVKKGSPPPKAAAGKLYEAKPKPPARTTQAKKR